MLRPSPPKASLCRYCCCHLAADIYVSDATNNPSFLRHCVVTAVAAVLLQPLPQIQICTAAVSFTSVSLSPRRHPAIAVKPSFLRHHCCFLDVTSASLLPLPPGHVSQVCIPTASAVLALKFLLLMLPPSQDRSATVLSQSLLSSSCSLCHKTRVSLLLLLSLPYRCCYCLFRSVKNHPHTSLHTYAKTYQKLHRKISTSHQMANRPAN